MTTEQTVTPEMMLEAISNVAQRTELLAEAVDRRFDQVEQEMDRRLSVLEERTARIEGKVDGLPAAIFDQLDTFFGSFDERSQKRLDQLRKQFAEPEDGFRIGEF